MIRHPPRSTLFPSTTPFRSVHRFQEAPEPRRQRVTAGLRLGGEGFDHGRAVVVAPQMAEPDELLELVGQLHAHVSILALATLDRKSTRLNSSHLVISYAVFC